jgi:hypothetical protein
MKGYYIKNFMNATKKKGKRLKALESELEVVK